MASAGSEFTVRIACLANSRKWSGRCVAGKELDAAGRWVRPVSVRPKRSENRACYRAGKVQFDLLAREPAFGEGLSRLLEGVKRHSVALLCSEKDPLDCHRAILVSRRVHEAGVAVAHILADGELESHADLEKRLLKLVHIPPGDLIRTRDECLDEAYEIQGGRIAYQDAGMVETEEKYR